MVLPTVTKPGCDTQNATLTLAQFCATLPQFDPDDGTGFARLVCLDGVPGFAFDRCEAACDHGRVAVWGAATLDVAPNVLTTVGTEWRTIAEVQIDCPGSASVAVDLGHAQFRLRQSAVQTFASVRILVGGTQVAFENNAGRVTPDVRLDPANERILTPLHPIGSFARCIRVAAGDNIEVQARYRAVMRSGGPAPAGGRVATIQVRDVNGEIVVAPDGVQV